MIAVDSAVPTEAQEEARERDRRAAEHLTVMRCQIGDRAAFEKLFDRYNDRLLYYLRRLLPSSAAAEDALQDVWLQVLRRVATLEKPGAFRAWVFRIAHNRAMNTLRKQGRSVELTARLDDDGAGAEAIEDRGDDEFDGVDARVVHAALESIGSAHREVLSLRFLGELSYVEIAEVVDCPIGTVKSRIYHAKRALRREIEAQEHPRDPSSENHGATSR